MYEKCGETPSRYCRFAHTLARTRTSRDYLPRTISPSHSGAPRRPLRDLGELFSAVVVVVVVPTRRPATLRVASEQGAPGPAAPPSLHRGGCAPGARRAAGPGSRGALTTSCRREASDLGLGASAVGKTGLDTAQGSVLEIGILESPRAWIPQVFHGKPVEGLVISKRPRSFLCRAGR